MKKITIRIENKERIALASVLEEYNITEYSFKKADNDFTDATFICEPKLLYSIGWDTRRKLHS